MIVSLDIETIPNVAMIDKLPEPECTDSRIKDPAKIAAHIAEKKAGQVEKMALDPLYGRVLCVALVGEGIETCPITTLANDFEERALLQWLFETHLNDPELRLVTWNGNGFDLPFVYRRAMALGVSPKHFGAPPLSHWTQRYKTDRHIDLMQIWGGASGREFTKLDAVARAILGESKAEIDVTQFVETMKTEEGRNEIVKYCVQDTKLVDKLFKRALGTLF